MGFKLSIYKQAIFIPNKINKKRIISYNQIVNLFKKDKKYNKKSII